MITAGQLVEKSPTLVPSQAENVDEDLIQMERIAHGDTEAFNRIYSRYRGLVYGIALRRTRDHDAAEDVVTDVMTRVYRSASSFHVGSRLSTWITRIAINASIDSVRKRSRDRTMTIDEAEELLDKFAAAVPARSDVADNEADIYREELSTALDESLRHINKQQQELLLMYYQDHLACAEIAAAKHVAVGTVKSRLHRARNSLRTGLECFRS